MNVALVTTLERGGPIEQSLLLARGLARDGARVLVTCANPELAERFATDGVRTDVAPLRHQADLAGAQRIWGLVRGMDVVHAHDRRAGLWVRLGPRPRRQGIRLYTVHGLPEPYLPPPVGPERPNIRAILLYRVLDAGLCARADAVIVPSQAIATELIDRLRYPAAKLKVIPNGIELPPFAPNGGELIGTFSSLEPVKGIDVFLRAVVPLAREHPEWPFVTFGVGSEQERLVDLARELGVADRVARPGFVPAHEALARLRVFVLSSYLENAPMALLEAMASGVPVVASAVAGVPEIADESVARMVPAGEPEELARAIELACTDRTGTEERVEAARERVQERFTFERNARRIGGLYEELLRARSR